jgi:hypothetical protein
LAVDPVSDAREALAAAPPGFGVDLAPVEGGWCAKLQRCGPLGSRHGPEYRANGVTMLDAVQGAVEMMRIRH